MTTIVLDENLLARIIEIGHYRNPQEAVSAILLDYVQTHRPQKTLFDKLHADVDMADDEIDNLFKRDKDVGRAIDL